MAAKMVDAVHSHITLPGMKDIPGYEGRYAITEDGRVWSHRRLDACNRNKWGIFMTPKITKPFGYHVVGLRGHDGKKRFHSIHRLVASVFLGIGSDKHVDHIDGNPANNTVSNLRPCNAFQNQGNRKISKNNTSGFKGVCFAKKTNNWQMSCRINGGRVVRRYSTKEEAARAYDIVAKQAHGEFARLNFPS